jgi:glyoxylase-like metal-dependent hydrolase (beta-lactamase superfamily II)
MISKYTNKPVVAVIYSHWHYTGGAQAYAATNPGVDIPVYGHPDLEATAAGSAGTMRDMNNRRNS